MSPTLLFALIAAAAASPVPVAVTGACPSAEAVTAALGSALGNEATTSVADAPRVSDQGDRFSVAVRGQTRQFVDAARDCDERARAAAVFIALALNPPVVPPPPAPGVRDGAAQQVVVPASPAPTPTAERWIDSAAAARLDGGPASDTSAAIGFEARAAVGWGWLGVAATAGVLAPTESTFPSVTVRQQRFPLSVAVTAQYGIGRRLAVAGAVGAALVPLTVRGEGLDGGSQSTRLDAGVRLAVELRIRATPRLAPFVDLHAEIFPRAYQLDVDPIGTVGSTGRLWLGVSAGLSFAVGANGAVAPGRPEPKIIGTQDGAQTLHGVRARSRRRPHRGCRLAGPRLLQAPCRSR